MKKFTENRFGITGWLFMLGLTVSAFVLVNISDVISRIQKEDSDINKFSHSEIYWITPTDTDNFYLRAPELAPKVISTAQNSSCSVSFYELAVNTEHQIDYSFIELVMNNAEDLKLISRDNTAISVNFPHNSNNIVIGESVLEITENGEGKILNINGISADVAGVLKNYSPCAIDNSIYAFWDSADEEFRDYLTSRITQRLSDLTLRVRFFSDKPIADDVQRFTAEMTKLGLSCEASNSYLGLNYWGHDTENLWYRAYNLILLPICIAFAVFTCFSTSYIWLLSRTKEISIRKAYGYSSAQILSLIIKDEIRLALPSIIAALIIQFVFCVFTVSLDYFDLFLVIKLAFVLIGVLLISLLCALRLIKTINGMSPAAALKEI